MKKNADNIIEDLVPKNDFGMVEPAEVWKPIVGFEGLYEVSNMGRGRSVERDVFAKDGRVLHFRGQLLKPQISRNGYLYFQFIVNKHVYREGIHRAVAKAFISNDNPERNHIDHIDGSRTNNMVSNLRWVTRTENMHNPITEARIDVAIGRSVVRISKDGSIKEYAQIKDVEIDGFNRHKVCSCCTGNRSFHKGYAWAYKEESENKNFDYYLQEKKRHYTEGNFHRRKPIIAYNSTEQREFSLQDEINNAGFTYVSVVRHIKDGKMYKGYYWRYRNETK